MDSLEATVEALSRRIRRLEDEQEIQRVIVMYGLALDAGDPERTAALYTENAFYDVDGTDVMQGRSAISAMVLSEAIQSLLPRVAHAIGPAAVEVRGDRATATGFSRTYLRDGDTIHLHRVAFNHWELERHDDRWQIARRVVRLVGDPDAQDVLRHGLVGLDPVSEARRDEPGS